jgi:uncharacterized protein YbaA (DUF1428 family)
MPKYIDGFALPVPKKNLKAYKKLAALGSKVWIEHGALQYFECMAEDPTPGFGMPFPKQLKCKKGEMVMFSWIMYKSRAHRDAVNKKVMKDPRLADCMGKKMPFDLKRMCCGGFEVLVEG